MVGEKPGLVARAEDSRPRGRGFESRRILDGVSDASYYIPNERKRIKVAKWGTPKKYLKKKKKKKKNFRDGGSFSKIQAFMNFKSFFQKSRHS